MNGEKKNDVEKQNKEFSYCDFHAHTIYSNDSSIRIKEMFQLYVKKNISVVTITDHNTTAGLKTAHKIIKENNFPIMLIDGEEIKTDIGEVIALDLNEEIPKGLPLEETLSLIKDQGAKCVIPHPYDFYRKGLFHNLGRVEKPFAIEVLNARSLSLSNWFSKKYAINHNLAQLASSDSHTYYEIGSAYTQIPFSSTKEEVFENIQKKRTVCCGKESPLWVHCFTTYRNLKNKIFNN